MNKHTFNEASDNSCKRGRSLLKSSICSTQETSTWSFSGRSVFNFSAAIFHLETLSVTFLKFICKKQQHKNIKIFNKVNWSNGLQNLSQRMKKKTKYTASDLLSDFQSKQSKKRTEKHGTKLLLLAGI